MPHFFRFRFAEAGDHTHIAMFAGQGANFTLGKCGDLCMRNDEFQYFRDALEIVFKEDVEFVDNTVTVDLERPAALPPASPLGDSSQADVRVSPATGKS